MSADLTLFAGDRNQRYRQAHRDELNAKSRAYRVARRGQVIEACTVCGQDLDLAGNGRPRLTCSDACRIRLFRERHGEDQRLRSHAHRAVARAIASGALLRQPCAVCGDSRRPEGHHHRGYSPDAVLDVVFLCSRHHKAAHREAAAA
jgi:hypothetical protein